MNVRNVDDSVSYASKGIESGGRNKFVLNPRPDMCISAFMRQPQCLLVRRRPFRGLCMFGLGCYCCTCTEHRRSNKQHGSTSQLFIRPRKGTFEALCVVTFVVSHGIDTGIISISLV